MKFFFETLAVGILTACVGVFLILIGMAATVLLGYGVLSWLLG